MSQPATSIDAYEQHQETGKVNSNQKIILHCLDKFGPLTALEIARKARREKMPISYIEVNRRLSELRKNGEIVKLGMKGPAPSGSQRAFKHQIVRATLIIEKQNA